MAPGVEANPGAPPVLVVLQKWAGVARNRRTSAGKCAGRRSAVGGRSTGDGTQGRSLRLAVRGPHTSTLYRT
jgi:hypothetical protein